MLVRCTWAEMPLCVNWRVNKLRSMMLWLDSALKPLAAGHLDMEP